MKTIIRSTITGGVFTALLISLGACAKDQNDSEFSGYANVINVAADGTTQFLSQNLENVLSDDLVFSETELDILVHMKEEEKLARDVYAALFEKWGILVFSRISQAENNHMNAVIRLLGNYGEEYTQEGEEGDFSIPELQELYSELMVKGFVSIEEAYKTGALIEEMDIKDLTEAIDIVTNENIILVFENLLRGSRNHLRAFNRQLTTLGVTYAPVYISQDEYDQIIASPNESGKRYKMRRHGGRFGQGNLPV